MIDASLAVAFSAGLVATVNPCGFAMLPAYLSWYVGGESSFHGSASLALRLGRGLAVGAIVSAGFLVVFAIAGTLITSGVSRFVDYVPWAAIAVGAALVVVGVAQLAGRELSFTLPKPTAAPAGRKWRAMLTFGASYAVASLSCTLPVFVAVVVSSFTRTGFAAGVATFLAYALGMSAVLFMLTIGVAVAQHSLLSALRALGRHVNRASGVLLVVAGGYIVYYWVFNLTSDPGETSGAGPVRFVERLSAGATNLVDDIGWRAFLAGSLLAMGSAGATVVARRRRHASESVSPGGQSSAVAGRHVYQQNIKERSVT